MSKDDRTWRLAWVIALVVLISLRNFFFRQLLAALLLFTVVFVIAAALIALCIGIDYALISLFPGPSHKCGRFISPRIILWRGLRVLGSRADGAVRRFKEIRPQLMEAPAVAVPNADGVFSRVDEVRR